MGFWAGIDTLGGGDFLKWDLKTPCIKSIVYKSQAKKMIPIVICTISQILVPYSPYPQIFFLWGANFFFRIL